MTKITFLVFANSSTGLGHYHRSLTLANHLHSTNKYQVEFISNKQVESYKTTIIQSVKDVYLSSWSVPNWMVIDLPFEVENDFYDLCEQLKIKTMVLNGIGHKVGDRSTLRIVQGFDEYNSKYSGSQYVIIRPELKALKKSRLNRINSTKWFVFGGSYDKIGLVKKFRESYPNRIIISIDKNDFVNPNTFSELLSECDYSVIHMGMSVWESVYLGIPTYVISGSDEHLKFALRMQAVGLIKAYGEVGMPDDFMAWIGKKIYKPNRDFAPDDQAVMRIERLLR